jgi:hypothetical protein
MTISWPLTEASRVAAVSGIFSAVSMMFDISTPKVAALYGLGFSCSNFVLKQFSNKWDKEEYLMDNLLYSIPIVILNHHAGKMLAMKVYHVDVTAKEALKLFVGIAATFRLAYEVEQIILPN